LAFFYEKNNFNDGELETHKQTSTTSREFFLKGKKVMAVVTFVVKFHSGFCYREKTALKIKIYKKDIFVDQREDSFTSFDVCF
jgi:hypothetical protein